MYFHKTGAKNWLVPWHQDRSIPVERPVESEVLTGWSEKEGATFVHAPDAVLAETVAIRLHLDDSTGKNSPLSGPKVTGQVSKAMAGCNR